MHTFFGLSEAELIAKYNTTTFPIQSKEKFLRVVEDAALRSQSPEGFEAAIKQQSQSSVDRLKQDLDDLSYRVVARSTVGFLDSTNPSVFYLLREPSLESIASYFLTASSAAQNRKTSPDAVCHQPQTTVLSSSEPSSKPVKRQTVPKIQYSGVQKNNTSIRTTVSKPLRRSPRWTKES
jgi:hypothetical protein